VVEHIGQQSKEISGTRSPSTDDLGRRRPARSCQPGIEESRLTVPVYVYRRQDGSTFEIEQRITENSLVSCPTTGQKVERVLQPFTPRYKGTGFYSTDHRKPKAKEPPKGGGGK
jgi:predicted nucleic acid-binding Zn ribbon protein